MVRNTERLGYALVLLQETALGYNTTWYKERCGKALDEAFDTIEQQLTNKIICWKFGLIPAADLINALENCLIERSTSTTGEKVAE